MSQKTTQLPCAPTHVMVTRMDQYQQWLRELFALQQRPKQAKIHFRAGMWLVVSVL